MRWSELYIPTLRDDPADAELVSHKLLVRAGYVRKLTSGVYVYLPLMQRVLAKISQIVREEMNKKGAQEITMPVLHPAELWQASGRWESIGKELFRLKDRHQREMALGPTHEEIVTNLVKGEIRSYRQLPLNLYQIQVKFRDEIRPRFGLMRCREFPMKDAYTFDASEESFKQSYQKMLDAYRSAFLRCGLETKMVESDTGAMGGKAAHEFVVIVETDGGESEILFCQKCDYAAHIDKAMSVEPNPPAADGKPKPNQKVDTPGQKTVEEVSRFLGVTPRDLVKTLLYRADGKIVAALIRGDRQINEVKLKNALGVLELEMADAATVEKVSRAPIGFAGPVGLSGATFVCDPEVTKLVNFVTGANEADRHLINVNINRDFAPDRVADIRNAAPGEFCPRCQQGVLQSARGIEVGNTFQLGTKYSESLGATFIDEHGQEKPFIMGSYGIGITRTTQAAIEKFHDQAGIIWPLSIAPFAVEILPVNPGDEKQKSLALSLYEELTKQRIEVLLDDREERAGVKFKDADLIGIPLRITIGEKSLAENMVEIKIRKTGETIKPAVPQAVTKTNEVLSRLAPDLG